MAGFGMASTHKGPMCRLRRSAPLALCLALACVLLAPAAAQSDGQPDQDLAAARTLLQTGKYAQAEEAYQELAASNPVDAALGLARCRSCRGDREAARQALADAIEKHPQHAALKAAAALLAFERGDHAQAGELAQAAIALDGETPAARWVQAELLRTSGQLERANEAYQWFVDFYNGHDVSDAESLRFIGLGAAQFARWNRLSDQFSFLVNELYPGILSLEEGYWQAHHEAGLLFLEKYNQAEAAREFAEALKLNPHAAPVHAATARLAIQNFDLEAADKSIDRALAINPSLAEAHRLRGDVLLVKAEVSQAIEAYEQALALNRLDETSLGRMAAALVVLDGQPADGAESRLGRLVDEALARNASAGELFFSLGEGLELIRRFSAAARYYREALARMPQLTAPRGALGLMAMRLGDEAEARRLLEESHQVDPFNVRVSNSIKVLDVLDGYAVVETEHFVIKFDRVRDELLARYAARYLEDEVYPQLVEQFGFAPPGKSLFEFFSRARNTSGHGWFSARMVGLPYVGTVGACAGKIVALASPNDMPKKYNWARVLKHEFVHVLNLQQTDFNIPHWFTEALAVQSEGYPRPPSWNDMLCQRVPQGETFNLDTINLGFIRPKTSLDWQMAYCQAQLYVQYMMAAHGADAPQKLLAAFRANLDLPSALKDALGVDQETFERGYTQHLADVVKGLSSSPKPQPMTLAELERAREQNPHDAHILARLAQAHLLRKSYAEARRWATSAMQEAAAQDAAAQDAAAQDAAAQEAARKHASSQAQGRQLAAYVLARVHLVVGETDEAIALLHNQVDRDAPQEHALNLLAGLKFKARQYQEAGELYELGAARDPSNIQWTRSLARLYLTTGDDSRLAVVLQRLAGLETDDVNYRKKLAQLALEAKDFERAAHWAKQANHIDVMDPQIHQIWGQALAAGGKPADAAQEYEVAVQLAPEDLALRLSCARAWADAGQNEKARAVLEKLLKLDADYPGAETLLESVSP